MAKVIDDPRPTAKERLNKTVESVQGSQAWNSIFRPGSIFRKGYTDSPRNRSYVIMNSVLYHLHPVKVKRHAVNTIDVYVNVNQAVGVCEPVFILEIWQ